LYLARFAQLHALTVEEAIADARAMTDAEYIEMMQRTASTYCKRSRSTTRN
jgi:hypothetical protein